MPWDRCAEGYDAPEKVSFAGDHPGVLSRVQLHELGARHNASDEVS